MLRARLGPVLLCLAILMLMMSSALSHPADTLWTRTYAFSVRTEGSDIVRTRDGGYIVTGVAADGDRRLCLVRIDATGDTLWMGSYGEPDRWLTEGVDETSDGGFVALARWLAEVGDTVDFMLVRTDPRGDTLWTRVYDWPTRDAMFSVQETSDGGLILVGRTIVSQDPYDSDLRLVRMNSSGDTLWTRLYGGSGQESGKYIQQTSDGGFIAAGEINHYGGQLTDMWLVRLQANGDTLWTRNYGGPWHDHASICRQTSDGGYVVGGTTTIDASWSTQYFIVKTDALGDTTWTRAYGTNIWGGEGLQETADGGYVASANTTPATDNYIYLLRMDSSGDTLWTSTYGEPGLIVNGGQVVEAYDGGFVLAGRYEDDVLVIRTVPPDYHVLDGRLDSDVSLVAVGDTLRLYADYDGEYLYVATQGVEVTSGLDHFILVGDDLSTPVAAPWAKAGTVASKTLFLGNEDDGGYNAWYWASEIPLGSDAASASGYYLEGLIRLDTHLGDPFPPAVYLAMGAYGSADLSPLVGQAPLGDGDGDIEAAEYVSFPVVPAPNNMDGELDCGANLVASNDTFNLYLTWDGENLYVATEGVGLTSGLDHFIFIGDAVDTPLPAPWAKSGTVAARALYLGNEDSNNWCGWFEETGSLLEVYAGSASGSVLEGVLRLGYHLGPALPDGIYVAVGAYASPDAGVLSAQVPAGNGDINLDAVEYYYVSLDVSGLGDMPDQPLVIRPEVVARPNPFRGTTSIEFEMPRGEMTRISVYDLRGRRVRTLTESFLAPGSQTARWDGTDSSGRRVSPGIYIVRLRAGSRAATSKIVLMK